jgi:SAM-dependent methyltransferase
MAEPVDRPMIRSRLSRTDMGTAWEENAGNWVAWARMPGHDSYWRFHRDLFLRIVPSAGVRTLDLGCGEGRLCRDLVSRGHRAIGLDASTTMLAAAAAEAPEIPVMRADAAAIPARDASFDLVVAFMSLQDIDRFEGAVAEASRVLDRGGRLCVAIVHPLNSAGMFEGEEADSPFVIDGSYLERSVTRDDLARDGLEMVFISEHRPLEAYANAIADAGLLIERIAEPSVPDEAVNSDRGRRWQRVPLFLHIRAVKA